MQQRRLTRLDRLVSGVDNALRFLAASSSGSQRPSPAAAIADIPLTGEERRHAAGLMRVNHAGEVAAQGLYQGHAAVARDPQTARQMQTAANEELDHLSWCEQRLRELGANPSRLGPLWYAGAWTMGAASGILGDRWSLGFVEETERQVADHLQSHLQRLPEQDAKSRAIVTQMRSEEEAHGARARQAGARPLPQAVRKLMRLTASVMTRTAYHL